MSALYNLEPQPGAKVVIRTTAGDILLELFSKQTPLTSRNFLQLCLDGYYDGTIFHRLVPGFIIQGGDPTGTGEGGEAIYDGGLFADEVHSRLKFNRRGLLGMANGGKRDDNGSQFFLTLGKTEELNGRNTMFGRVAGDTIYNLMKMGEAELRDDGSEMPLYTTKVTGTEILVNPFEDMVPRVKAVKAVTRDEAAPKKKAKKKTGKALLSFGEDEGDAVDVAPVTKKAKYNTKLISSEQPPDATATDDVPIRTAPSTTRTKSPSPKPQFRPPPTPPKPTVAKTLPTRPSQTSSRSSTSSPEPPQVEKVTSLLDKTNAQIAELKASMKRNVAPAPAASGRKKSALEQMIPETSTRGRKRRHGATSGTASSDKAALDILNTFKKTLDQARPESKPERVASPLGNGAARKPHPAANVPDDDNDDDEEAHLCDLHFIANCQSCQAWHTDPDPSTSSTALPAGNNAVDDDAGWMSHALSFEKDRLGKDLTWKRKNEEELVVIDPREKGKEILDKKKGGGRAWDKEGGFGFERERESGRGRGREGAKASR
ncbi:MAG: Peptidyl-prolyl isomerase cwc27 [Piccolia ochrophora]|nr:MAG: Peptidyl-prolyl isomerase cwc27 [Piccolia ochrophora]